LKNKYDKEEPMEKYDYVIVGSGAGGGTLARELTKRGKHPLVVETGIVEEKVGTFFDALRFFDKQKITRIPRKSREGVFLWRTLMAGGSTMASCGNGVRCLENELSELGANIEAELAEAEAEIPVAPIAERLLSDGSREIMRASRELGYNMELMPKFINDKACRKCGQCCFGCAHGAKWTSLNYLKEAKENGARVIYNTRCSEVISDNGRVKGIRAVGPDGEVELMADVVVLAAGGLGTPEILLKSGIKNAGTGLFLDLIGDTYGITDGLNLAHEPTMALVSHDFYESDGFILSPYVHHAKFLKFFEVGMRGFTISDEKSIGIMTKIRDEGTGQVYPDGSVSKTVTEKDRQKLNKGAEVSREILKKAGAKSTLVSKAMGGAHPGGTAAIGKVVDKDLQTEVNNLFVCDASVLPTSAGLPPILTIVALAKRLSKTLAP
jgi:choline dehydrogenase-like flavoprotein